MVFSRNGHVSWVLEVFENRSILWGATGVPSVSHSLHSYLVVNTGKPVTKTEFEGLWGDFGKTAFRELCQFQGLQRRHFYCYEIWEAFATQQTPNSWNSILWKAKWHGAAMSPSLWYGETSSPLSSPLFYLLTITWIYLFFSIPTAAILVQVTVIYSLDFYSSFLPSDRPLHSKVQTATCTL